MPIKRRSPNLRPRAHRPGGGPVNSGRSSDSREWDNFFPWEILEDSLIVGTTRAVSQESVSDQQHADEKRFSRTAKSCGPDAPTLASSSRRFLLAQPGSDKTLRCGRRWQRARSPGRARHTPLKPLRAGMPGDSGVLVYSCAFYQYKVHTRPRVRRAPGVPHALLGRKIHQSLGRFASRARSRLLTRSRMWTRRHSGMVRRTRPQMRNCASGNLEIPGSMLRIAPE